MAHIPFFYSEDLKFLNEEDSYHFFKVLRKREGDRFKICDGKGKIWYAKAKAIKKGKVEIEKGEFIEEKQKKGICLATAIPKGQRMSFLIEKVCEIGVDVIYPLITKHSSVKEITPGMMKRFQNIARASCSQSEKGYLTKIEKPVSLKEIFKNFNKTGVLERFSKKENWGEFIKDGEILLIGPEGGWAEEELKIFKEKNSRFLPLTEEPLRVETAAIVGLSFYYSLKF